MSGSAVDELFDELAAQESLAKRLFEQQFLRAGGRKPADPTWDELDEAERDEYREHALDAQPLIKAARDAPDRAPGEIGQGRRVRHNLYRGPRPVDHFAVVLGPYDQAADIAAWMVDGLTAWIAAGHPMPGGDA